MKTKRIVIATGGTGGHLYPAIALAQNLQHTHPGVQICFAGGGLVGSPFLPQGPLGWGIVPISAPKPSAWHPFSFLKNFCRGVQESRALLQDFSPDLMVGFGSFHTVPLLVAAQSSDVPYLLHEGNAVPGRVNRLFSGRALSTAVTFTEAGRRLAGRTHRVAMPLRSQFLESPIDPRIAREQLGLDPDLFTLLVMGGSQGAHALNSVMQVAAPLLRSTGPLQILHLVGPNKKEDAQSVQQAYDRAGIPSIVKTFEQTMERAWSAASLCLARSGASSLAEQTACGVPGILVPFPNATDDHQTENARCFEEEFGGAIIVPQSHLSAHHLARCIGQLRADDERELNAKREAMRKARKGACTLPLVELVSEMAGWRSAG
ncbi:MAG: UDP-N-acetylglucosamine--N-acetylmuramyl-(pentapeptide) pyrophosphoryl-undecaprenol N-acetylglucosamine transferase [Chlamydiia bacterium]